MLRKKYLTAVSLLLYLLLFSCLFIYSSLSGEVINTQNSIIYFLFVFITLIEVISIALYVKFNKISLMNISMLLMALDVLYCTIFVLIFCGEEYSSAVASYIILCLPEIFSAVLLVGLYIVGIKKLSDTKNIKLNNKILAVFVMLSFLLFLFGCLTGFSFSFSASTSNNFVIVRNDLQCKYPFLIALIILAVGFWLDVYGKLNKNKTIFIFVLYFIFTMFTIFLPAITSLFATEETYENNVLTAFLMSLNQSFYQLSINFYSYSLSGSMLSFVISEILSYIIIYSAIIVVLSLNNRNDYVAENISTEKKDNNITLAERLSIIDQLVIYKHEGIINDSEFDDLKLKALNESSLSIYINDSDFNTLKKLKELYDSGILTADEFETEKKR